MNTQTHTQTDTKDYLSVEEEELVMRPALDQANNYKVQAKRIQVSAKPTPFTDSVAVETSLAKLGETIGQFKPYDSQLPIASIPNTRIVKMLYQVNAKTGKKVAQNSYVRVSCKHLTEEMILARISELTPYILGYLQGVENTIIKEYHVAGLLSITSGNLSLDKIITKLEESETSARLSKDKIEEWFTSHLADALTTNIAAKMNLNDDCSEEELYKLESVLNAYKAKFVSLANPKAYIKEADCTAMINVIKSCDADNNLLGNRFIIKLEQMSQKSESLLMSL